MPTHVLLIHGAGKGAHLEDKKLAESLHSALGPGYEVRYPQMPNEEDAPYEQWKEKIESELERLEGQVMLVGHSIGASVLIKYLCESGARKSLAGIFLVAGPFWGGDGWRYEGYEELELAQGAGGNLPGSVPVFLYHCRDDEIVPFDHLSLYAHILPQATAREIEEGGHQCNNDLSMVVEDIKGLKHPEF